MDETVRRNIRNAEKSSFHQPHRGVIGAKDDVDLAKAGKKPVLKRRFGLASMLGFNSAILITWEGVLTGLVFGLQNGGPAGLIYSYLLTWAGTMSVFISMSELASMYPAYHWSAILAPSSCKKFLSYFTGWITIATWVIVATGTSYVGGGQLIFSTVSIGIPSFNPTGWQGTLMQWAWLLIAALFNTLILTALPVFEVIILIIHLLGFVGMLIPIVYAAPRANAHDIFTNFYNLGGWSSVTLSFLVGLRGNAAALLGGDGAIHMAEEVENSAINVPRAMIYSTIFNGILGFGMLIAVLFSGGNLLDLAEANTQFPYTIIFANAIGNTGGAITLSTVLAFMSAISTVSAVASASRMLWSFSRDRGVPFWRKFRKINRRSSIPTSAVVFVIICSGLLGLIGIGSSTVFEDVISLGLEGFYSSYLVAISLLLYRRLRGEIVEPTSDAEVVSSACAENSNVFFWGPWRVKGWLGTANNIVAIAYLVVIIFFGFWPGTVQVTAADMNYSVVILGAVVIASLVYFAIEGKKTYTGPVIELQAGEAASVTETQHAAT